MCVSCVSCVRGSCVRVQPNTGALRDAHTAGTRARSRSIDIRSDDRVPSVAARRNLAARARVAATVSPRVANVASSRGRRAAVVVRAAEDPKKPAILRENEKEAWLSKGEREGENPLKDPMAMFAIGGIMVPFIILAVAGAAGYIGN